MPWWSFYGKKSKGLTLVSILLYGCTTRTLTKRLEKKLDDSYTRMLRAILNKSWQQHPTRHQLYGHLPPITKTIQARRTRHAGYCWRSKGEIVSDVLLWTPAYGQSKAGRPARTYIQQLCDYTRCNPEDLPEAMNDRETWRERVWDIRASRTTWWWWYNSTINKIIIWISCLFHICIHLYIYINRDIGPAVRVFANGPGDLGSIPGRVIPKTLKMELDTTLLNTQHYKVRFKGKVEQSREWSSALPYTLV